jgi:hypothetical protein
MYKLLFDELTQQESTFILRTADCLNIPKVEGNRDYQQYLEWLEEGNEPLPAD